MWKVIRTKANFYFDRFPWLLPLLIIAIGFGLRAYHWQTYPFNFDQVQILENATKILHGHPTLIGPRTGPALLFTGPLIYYLTAAVMLVIASPYTIVVTALLLAIIAGTLLYWLSCRAINRQTGLVILSLWALSPFIIAMDRIPWNPNLSILASSLVFFSVYKLVAQNSWATWKRNWLDWGLIGIGCFLGYQAHFSGLLLPVLVAVAFGLHRKIHFWSIVAGMSGLAVALLPTLLFDLRNQWFNLHGLLDLLHSNQSAPLSERFTHFLSVGGQSLVNLGGIFIWHSNALLLLTLGLIIIAYAVSELKTASAGQQKTILLSTVWLTISAVLMSFYRANQPEYYLLIQVPAGITLIGHSLLRLFKTNTQWVLVGLGVYSCALVMMSFPLGNGLNLGNQLGLSHEIHYQNKTRPISEIVYDMQDADSVGLKYLLQDISIDKNGTQLHLQYPYLKGTITTFSSHDLGAWFDPRQTPNYHYLTTTEYVIGSPSNISILADEYPRQPQPPGDIYQLLLNNGPLAQIQVITRQRQERPYNNYIQEFPKAYEQRATWQVVMINQTPTWIYTLEGMVILVPVQNGDPQTLLPTLNQLELHN